MADKMQFLAISSNAEAGGIYAASLNPETGSLQARCLTACPLLNYLIRDDRRDVFYGTVSKLDPEGKMSGVAVFDKACKLLGTYPTGGAVACHLTLSPDGKFLYTAQYIDGTVSEFPLMEDGTPGKARVLHHSGSGILPRQNCPHSHFMSFSPDGRFLCNVDLGLDTVFFYPYAPETGISDTPVPVRVPAGEGPRHLIFSPSGTQFFVANELGSTVTNFGWCNSEARAIETLPTLHQEPAIENWPGAIRLSPDGKYLFISNRGDDSITCFELIHNHLKFVRTTGSGGHWPRDIAFTPDGKFLIAANERSGNLASFRYQPENGGLIPCGRTAEVPTVLNIVF